ncbi:MAG: DUF1593 domain-containing protein, partial [Firmicutes bacterium]|nr:DUF1593 domain-containing protein [Bacillota bacterium]
MKGALTGERYRVIVSSDIGGTDPDDSQSMVHYLLYSDLFDTEGFISSPMGKGRVDHFLEVIDEYEKDYHKLCRYAAYPKAENLRAMVKQGAIDPAGDKGYAQPTEGSEWIIQCAKKEDPRPLYILVWGLIEDLAQALHDAPEIAPKLRVHFIGGFNKMCGLNAYEYVRRNFPDLWMIEDNSTYRGWFVGGDQSGDWGNHSFTMRYAKDHGALGEYFTQLYEGTIKMGDTPTVSWLLGNDPTKPEELGWAGRFVKVNDMPCVPLQDQIEVFQVAELELDGPALDWPEEKPA